MFVSVKSFKPESSRSESVEIFLFAKGLRVQSNNNNRNNLSDGGDANMNDPSGGPNSSSGGGSGSGGRLVGRANAGYMTASGFVAPAGGLGGLPVGPGPVGRRLQRSPVPTGYYDSDDADVAAARTRLGGYNGDDSEAHAQTQAQGRLDFEGMSAVMRQNLALGESAYFDTVDDSVRNNDTGRGGRSYASRASPIPSPSNKIGRAHV